MLEFLQLFETVLLCVYVHVYVLNDAFVIWSISAFTTLLTHGTTVQLLKWMERGMTTLSAANDAWTIWNHTPGMEQVVSAVLFSLGITLYLLSYWDQNAMYQRWSIYLITMLHVMQ